MLPVGVEIKEQSCIAFIAAKKLKRNKVAIVLGNTIYLHNTKKEEFLNNKSWVLHELEHIKQFKKYGFIRFIFLYVYESVKNGYSNNKYEAEARNAEKQ